jgi:DNA-binding NarL/FixJ family response regulator
MRVALIGRPSDRARLRSVLEAAGVEIVREAAALSATDVAGLDGDVLIVASRDRADLDRAHPSAESLTPREIEVLELLAEGWPNKRIAARLGISDQTVKFHVAAICGKLEAANRTDAVRRAVKRGLIAL